jgi:oligoribonuclease (3'-5' exoribonuclease)
MVKQTKKQILLALLKKCKELGKKGGMKNKIQDIEVAHKSADEALLDYIEDKEITKAFNEINKWYS